MFSDDDIGVTSLCRGRDTCTQERTRECDNPAPDHGGNECEGPGVDTPDCYSGLCCPGESEYRVSLLN